MFGCLIVLKSLTLVEQAAAVLRGQGIRASVVRPGRQLFHEDSCRVAVSLPCSTASRAVQLLQYRGIGPCRVFETLKNGDYREVQK